MRTHRAKSAHLPAEYIPPTFLTRTPPPPFPQVDGGGCYREKFFLFFKTLLQLVKFSLGIPYQLLSFLILYLSDFDLEFTSSRLRFSTLIIIWDSVFFDSIFRLVFSSHQFRLVSVLQILRFDSSTLYLFNFSACYKQTSMLI